MRHRRFRIYCQLFLSLAGVGILAAGVSYFTGTGPFAAAPATCRDFAERLRSRGMKIRWVSYTHKYPAICIFRDSPDLDNLSDYSLRVNLESTLNAVDGGAAVIVQYPTPQEARESAGTAGTTSNAFAWGRFVISGFPERVAEIKSRL